MYFFKLNGKQILDLKGNLIITHNKNLVTGRIKSAAPSAIRNALYIQNISQMSIVNKILATLFVVRFIWSTVENKNI